MNLGNGGANTNMGFNARMGGKAGGGGEFAA